LKPSETNTSKKFRWTSVAKRVTVQRKRRRNGPNMNESLQLFIELMKARNAHEVRLALDDYSQAQVGGQLVDLPFKYVGGRKNNRGPIEVMESIENSVYEKVMNGFDALIELRQHREGFSNGPTNAAQALAEIGDNPNEPGVYLITSRAHTRTGSVGQPKKRSNVVVVDEGIGIQSDAFHDTIMSLEGSNKLSNPLMAGSYGFGGSAVYRYSTFTIIWSRSIRKPDVISFTVVHQNFGSGARYPSYVYLIDPDGEVLSFNVGDLPSEMVIAPSAITSQNIMDASHLIPVPRHGTGIKVFELENFAASPRIYSFLRDRGFGMPIPCRFRNGVEKGDSDDSWEDGETETGPDGEVPQRGNTRRLYNATGLRHSLNDPTSRKAYKVAFHQLPIGIMPDGDQAQATLECWVLERADRDTKVARAGEPVIESILGKDRRNTPCYVTLNGMTQENLPTHVILKNVRLPYLRNHLILEINCDQMDPQTKGRFFTSSRERLTQESVAWIKDEITKYLTMQAEPDGELAKLNAKYRDAVIAGNDPDAEAASRRGMELMARLMRTGAIGTLLSRFGAPSASAPQSSSTREASLQTGRLETEGAQPLLGSKGGKGSQLILMPIPDILEVRKHTFKQGAAEWVVVRTNGYNDWDQAIEIAFPEYLSVVERLPLANGRLSLYVQCSTEVVIGTKGRIEAVLDRSRVGLPSLSENAIFTVIRGTAGISKPSAPIMALPNIELKPVEPGQPDWEHMHSGDVPPEKVAFNFIDEGSRVRVFWNKKFAAFTSAIDEVERRYKSVPVSKKFVIDYTTYLSVLTLAALDVERSAIDVAETNPLVHRMRAEAVTANAMLLTLLIAKDDVEEFESAA
jgi:hypothetical protein